MDAPRVGMSERTFAIGHSQRTCTGPTVNGQLYPFDHLTANTARVAEVSPEHAAALAGTVGGSPRRRRAARDQRRRAIAARDNAAAAPPLRDHEVHDVG